MQQAERIGKSGFQQLREPGAFFVGEPGGETVVLGPRDVDLLMGHVQIAAENDRFDGRQAGHVIAERLIPLLPVGKPASSLWELGV